MDIREIRIINDKNKYLNSFFFSKILITWMIRIEKAGKYGKINLPPPTVGVKYQITIVRSEYSNMNLIDPLNLLSVKRAKGRKIKYNGDIGSGE